MKHSHFNSTRSNRSSYSGGFRSQQTRPRFRGKYIDPTTFINQATAPEELAEYQSLHTFADFGLADAIKRNVSAHGYTNPTPIQDEAIGPILDGKDLIGLANTGTGKTAAFLLPIINHLLVGQHAGTALIIVPTRELALQIDQEFRLFAQNLRLYSCVCVGGASMQRQISSLYRNPHVVIGTPGRLKDLFMREYLHVSRTDIFVLDEADRMFDMGFSKDIHFLVDQLPTKRQTLCFSATMTPNIEALINKIMIDPTTVSVRTKVSSAHIQQDIVHYDSPEHKLQTLLHMLSQSQFEKVLIFGETKHGVQRLSDNLVRTGIAAEAIHGNKSQAKRQKALAAFKDNAVQALVATDVAARGLDIPNVSHVINYDQPNSYDDYIHRIGRTGRAGNGGNALTFVPHR